MVLFEKYGKCQIQPDSFPQPTYYIRTVENYQILLVCRNTENCKKLNFENFSSHIVFSVVAIWKRFGLQLKLKKINIKKTFFFLNQFHKWRSLVEGQILIHCPLTNSDILLGKFTNEYNKTRQLIWTTKICCIYSAAWYCRIHPQRYDKDMSKQKLPTYLTLTLPCLGLIV